MTPIIIFLAIGFAVILVSAIGIILAYDRALNRYDRADEEYNQ